MAEYIKREDVIEAIAAGDHTDGWENIFCGRALIGMINQIPSADVVERKTGNEDLISRQTAIDALNEHRSIFCDNTPETFRCLPYDEKCRVGEIDNAVATLINLPSAQPERKTGKWIWDDEGYHCSECFYHAYGNTGEVLSGDWNYCPNCGARMVTDDV